MPQWLRSNTVDPMLTLYCYLCHRFVGYKS